MKYLKKGTVGVLVFVLLFSATFTQGAFASSVQNAQNQKNRLEQKKADVENTIDSLEKQKLGIIAYIEKLDKQLGKLTAQMERTQDKIEKKAEQLDQTKKDLKAAKETEKNQYETMKKRIKYMYENGSQDYIEIVLKADSFGDLLNRVEYINKISEYDNNLLDNYKETKQLISEKKTEQTKQLEELNDMKKELEIEQDGVEKLMSNKRTQLAKKKEAIRSSKAAVDDYQAQIQKQEELIEQLLEEERRKAEEEERRRREEEERKRREEEEKRNNQAANNQNSQTNGGSSSGQFNSSAGLRWPLNVSGTITSTFGYRESPTAGASSNHKGIDIAVPTGTPVVAAGSGKVVVSSYQAAAGNYIMIYHGNGLYTVYMHNSSLKVSVGETVSKGQVIALSGSTGVSTGPHLHFGVNKNGSYVNPLNYVSR